MLLLEILFSNSEYFEIAHSKNRVSWFNPLLNEYIPVSLIFIRNDSFFLLSSLLFRTSGFNIVHLCNLLSDTYGIIQMDLLIYDTWHIYELDCRYIENISKNIWGDNDLWYIISKGKWRWRGVGGIICEYVIKTKIHDW